MSEKPRDNSADAASNESSGGPACPICGEPADASSKSFPFCSRRCRLIDLGNWLDESYVVSRPIEQRDLEEGD